MRYPDPERGGQPNGWTTQGTRLLDEPFGREDLHAIRFAVAAHADTLGASADQVEQLVIVASELATNALAYGGGARRLSVWREGAVLRCRVSDEGPGLADPETAGVEQPSVFATRGRGLWIARQLSDRLEVTAGPAGTSVTVSLDLDAEPGTAGRGLSGPL